MKTDLTKKVHYDSKPIPTLNLDIPTRCLNIPTREDYRQVVCKPNPDKNDRPFKFVQDAKRGCFEVPAGCGSIEVCTGYKIRFDEDGRRIEVLVYSTQYF